MTNIENINLQHVLTPTFHSQLVYQIEGMLGQYTNLGMLRPHWNDQNITFLKCPKVIDIKFLCLPYHKLLTSSTELFLQKKKSRELHKAVTVAKGSDISACAVRQIFSFLFHVSGEKAQLLGGSHSRRGKIACLVFCP